MSLSRVMGRVFTSAQISRKTDATELQPERPAICLAKRSYVSSGGRELGGACREISALNIAAGEFRRDRLPIWKK
jgi:hypothetical protein